MYFEGLNVLLCGISPMNWEIGRKDDGVLIRIIGGKRRGSVPLREFVIFHFTLYSYESLFNYLVR